MALIASGCAACRNPEEEGRRTGSPIRNVPEEEEAGEEGDAESGEESGEEESEEEESEPEEEEILPNKGWRGPTGKLSRINSWAGRRRGAAAGLGADVDSVTARSPPMVLMLSTTLTPMHPSLTASRSVECCMACESLGRVVTRRSVAIPIAAR